MATKSNGSRNNRTQRRRDVLNRVKREATTSRMATAAGLLALGVAACALWRKAEWQDEARHLGQAFGDRLRGTAEQLADRARALGTASSDERKTHEPLAAIA